MPAQDPILYTLSFSFPGGAIGFGFFFTLEDVEAKQKAIMAGDIVAPDGSRLGDEGTHLHLNAQPIPQKGFDQMKEMFPNSGATFVNGEEQP